MILFPGISPKVILRVLFPFIFTTTAMAVIVLAYIRFTDDINVRVVRIEQEQVIQTAKSIIGLSLDEYMSSTMFNRNLSDGFIYLDMKSEFLGSFNLSEFMIIHSLNGDDSDFVPFEEDSLAQSAISSGSPVMRYLERGKENSLLVFYPIVDSSRNTSMARMVFRNVHGNEILSSRYNFYIISAAAVILLILPGLFLKLADLRRQIEISGFYQTDRVVNNDSREEIANSNICPSSLLDGSQFPPVFRLDDGGKILFMNSNAAKIIDMSSNDMTGAKFHELPCFSAEDRELIEYPEKEEPSVYTLGIIGSSGSSRKSAFRIEKLSSTGYAVSVQDIEIQDERLSRIEESEINTGEDAVLSGRLSKIDIQHIRAIIEEGREKFQSDQAIMDRLILISDVLSGKEKYHETEEHDQVETIEIFSELDAIAAALNDVLPERASIELDVPGFLPQVEFSRVDFTQIVKNMVFYSLESTSGSVRIRLGARDIPSPVSDSVFSTNCDRTVSRSVSISLTDGTRMPAVLKEALLDPETDLSGIQRDYGSHISSVAAVLSRLDCHPVFTEGSSGTTLNILFRTSEDYLFDVLSHAELPQRSNLSSMKLALCDASRAVRESVSDVLSMYGIDVVTAADLEEMKELMAGSKVDYLLLDYSAINESMGEVVSDVRKEFPDLEIVLTTGFSISSNSLTECPGPKVSILKKPYSTDELLNILESFISPGAVHNNE